MVTDPGRLEARGRDTRAGCARWRWCVRRRGGVFNGGRTAGLSCGEVRWAAHELAVARDGGLPVGQRGCLLLLATAERDGFCLRVRGYCHGSLDPVQ